MKKILVAVAALLTVAGLSTSCGKGLKGFEKTSNGNLYKFHVKTDSEKAKIGDVIVAEVWDYGFTDSVQFTNAGNPMPVFQLTEGSPINDVLALMGKGDSITIAIPFDTIKKQNPNMNAEGIDVEKYPYQRITIKVSEVASEAREIAQREAYIKEKGITQTPNDNGVYVIIEQEGKGAVVTKGKTVSLNYTGTFLDGKAFDTSLESVAKEHGLQPRPSYEPLSFEVGAGQMIPGMDQSVENLKVGSKVKLIIPSSSAYGMGRPGIPPFSTLIFDIEILKSL